MAGESRQRHYLPPVFLGVFSHLRLVQTSIEDMVYVPWGPSGSASIPGPGPGGGTVLPPDRPQGMTRLERIGVVASGPLQLLLTAASMVGASTRSLAG